MYGLVNRALQDFVTKHHGSKTWDLIKEKANLSDAPFIGTQGYDDAITYSIVGAATEVLNQGVETLLEAFGKHWVLETAPSAYGELLDSAGASFPEFMTNLPDLHSRILLVLPNLDPPEFRIKDRTRKRLTLCYQSHRQGLQHFVIGLVHGLGERFDTQVEVAWTHQGSGVQEPDEFQITWI